MSARRCWSMSWACFASSLNCGPFSFPASITLRSPCFRWQRSRSGRSSTSGWRWFPRYVLRGRCADLYAAAAIAAFSGLCHPFEVFAIMAGKSLTLVATRSFSRGSAIADALVVCIPGTLSVVRYTYFSITTPWLYRLRQLNNEPLPDFLHLLAELGIPAAFVLVNLVVGARLRAPTDVVLQCWFAAVLPVIHTPKLFWAWHVADGFPFITALLAVRQLSQISYLSRSNLLVSAGRRLGRDRRNRTRALRPWRGSLHELPRRPEAG